MQSNVVNAMLLSRGFMDFVAPAAQNIRKGDETFMGILSERMEVTKETGVKSRPMRAELYSQSSESSQKTRDATKSMAVKSKNINENTEGWKAEKSKRSKNPDKIAVLKTEDESEKEINSLEAMIALLEQLLARLDVKGVMVDSEAAAVAGENMSTMELLEALVSQNIQKLEDLIDRMQPGQQSPDVIAFIEKINEILEKANVQKAEIGGQSVFLEDLAQTKAEKILGKDLINQMKAQCSQLINNLKEQVSVLKEDLGLELADEASIADNLITIDTASAEQATDSQPEKNESKSEEPILPKQDAIASNPVIHKDDDLADYFIIPNQQNINVPLEGMGRITKAQMPLPEKPLAQTVTNQVMMKIKLMAGENRQEIEMSLKPESLGKLSLRIIHERGEVLAKITAESQQVKEILESNMQMLKDALEKSGLSVQSLSVSVGNKNNGSSKGSEGEGLRKQARGSEGDSGNLSIKEVDDIRTKIEKEYFDNTSKINLTA